jgi:hypothetical protein
MTGKRKAPARGDAPRAEITSNGQADYRLNRHESKAEFPFYWLHVGPDGVERIFTSLPEGRPARRRS